MTQIPTEVTIRAARAEEMMPICEFGRQVLPPHYTPLIGETAAWGQVDTWWTPERTGGAIAAGDMQIAIVGESIVGVAEHGMYEGKDVIFKLYVHPNWRGHHIGAALIDAVWQACQPRPEIMLIEHFAGNSRAGQFYEREGFAVEWIDEHSSGDHRLDTVWRSCSREVGR